MKLKKHIINLITSLSIFMLGFSVLSLTSYAKDVYGSFDSYSAEKRTFYIPFSNYTRAIFDLSVSEINTVFEGQSGTFSSDIPYTESSATASYGNTTTGTARQAGTIYLNELKGKSTISISESNKSTTMFYSDSETNITPSVWLKGSFDSNVSYIKPKTRFQLVLPFTIDTYGSLDGYFYDPAISYECDYIERITIQNFNKGSNSCNGELVIIFDSNDYIPVSFYNSQYAYINFPLLHFHLNYRSNSITTDNNQADWSLYGLNFTFNELPKSFDSVEYYSYSSEVYYLDILDANHNALDNSSNDINSQSSELSSLTPDINNSSDVINNIDSSAISEIGLAIAPLFDNSYLVLMIIISLSLTIASLLLFGGYK